MKADITHKDHNSLKISWTDERKGFGELTMKWDGNQLAYILDSEMMGVDTVLEIFNSATNHKKEE